MGNCFKVSSNKNAPGNVGGVKKKETRSSNEIQLGENRKAAGDGSFPKADEDAKLTQNESHVLALQTSASNSSMNQTKDPSWLRILAQKKPERDYMNDNEDECSIFGDNWDPALFEQRLQTPSPPIRSESVDQSRRSKLSVEHWKNWNSDENFTMRCNHRKHRIAVVSSSLLGFSQYPTEAVDNSEWFRNGELESPQPDATNFLIKGKRHQNESEFEVDLNPSSKDSCLLHEGWIRYTMFLHQDKSDIYAFYSNFRNAKHIFMSLENKTGCELRISKQIYSYRGKLVRTFIIDGPSRKHIIRCYTSLPTVLAKMLICECERPSLVEARPRSQCQELGLSVPTLMQRQICV